MAMRDARGAAGPSIEWNQWLNSSLSGLEQRNLLRVLRPFIPGQSSLEVQVLQSDLDAWIANQNSVASVPTLASRPGTQTIKLFCLNDYLGLSDHPAVREAASAAALAHGNGPRSSQLAGGYTCYHRDLELALAELKGTEDALLFPTGFAANLAVASALAQAAGHGSLAIFSDELNHASIVDGARLAKQSGASVHIYRHNDMAHLEELLYACPPGTRKLVMTDSLFSMDGDFAPLRELVALKRRHSFLLAVDEAHATLVCGNRGGGAADLFGVEHDIDLHVGTLSKAFGCLGGFVACSRQWRHLFVNKGRSQVFSTALPVPIAAAAQAALVAARDEPWRRQRVWDLSQRVGDELGVKVVSPIIPIVLGPEVAAIRAGAELLQRGVYVPAIRPPTVPAGTSRLRISLSAAHSDADVGELIDGIKAIQHRPAASDISALVARL